MIFGGLEVIALKWLGGHVAQVLGAHLAHASTTTVAHIAYTAGHNTLAAAAASGSTMGALTTLGHGAQSAYKVGKPMMAEKTLTDDRASDDEKLGAVLFITAMAIAESLYESKKHRGKNGCLKTELIEMEPCTSSCSCSDYHATFGDGSCEECGHPSWQHSTISAAKLDDDSVDWLWLEIAFEVYPNLKNQDGEGNYKTKVRQIEPCIKTACPCWDFDLSELNTFDIVCSCGHDWDEHEVTGEWLWIIKTMAALALKKALEDD